LKSAEHFLVSDGSFFMRRLAVSMLTACGLAILSACSGGTGFSTSGGTVVPTSISFSNGSGMVNDFFVAPTYTDPTTPSQALSVTAVASKGSGVFTEVDPGVTYTWAARFVNASDPPSVSEYLVGPTPSGYKSCAIATTTPAVPIYYQPGGQAMLTPLPTATTAQQVYIAPVAGVAAPYCLVLQATSHPGGVIGAITVVVSNSP
jgi:hypothetical protein